MEIKDILPFESNYSAGHMTTAVFRIEQDSRRTNGYYRITGNLERMGDHALNIAKQCQKMK